MNRVAHCSPSRCPRWRQKWRARRTRKITRAVRSHSSCRFAPAGGTDILARLLGQKLEQRLGKPFVVENRPGAGTVLATNYVAKSPPDGYTIMMSVSSLAINATLYKKLPYDPAKDLALVALIASVPFVLVVNPSLPVHSVGGAHQACQTKAAELRFRRDRGVPSSGRANCSPA